MNPNSISRKIYNWTYVLSDQGSALDFKIIPNHTKKSPERLFKYYSLSDNSIDSLKEERFYLAQPHDFNDLFDSSYSRLDFVGIDLELAKKLIISFKENEIEQRWKKNKLEVSRQAHYDYYKQLISMCGILCMTSNPKDELMWGYYTNNEGFCLEFDYQYFGDHFKGPHPINYIDFLQPIPLYSMGPIFSFLTLMTTKKKHWLHEDEYRFLVKSSSGINFKTTNEFKNSDGKNGFIDRYESFGKNSLKSITLGFKFLKNEKLKIINDFEYEIQFISEKGNLKKIIFETIIKKELVCFSLTQEVPSFELNREEWKISKKTEEKFNIVRVSNELK